MKQEVSNINFSGPIVFCESKGIDPATLLKNTNLDIEYVKDLKKYCTWDQANIIFNNISETIPVTDYDEMFKHSALGDAYNTVVPQILEFLSPKIPYWVLSAFLGKKLFKNISYSLKTLSERTISMRMEIQGSTRPVPFFFEVYEYVYRFLSLHVSKSESIVTMNRTNSIVEYTIILPEKTKSIKKYFRILKLLKGIKSSVLLLKEVDKSNQELEKTSIQLQASISEKQKLINEINKQNVELEELFIKKTNLLRILVHDISSPVMVMEYHLKCLKKANQNETASTHLAMINKSIGGIKGMIEGAKSLEDIASMNKTFESTKVSVTKAVELSIDLASSKYINKKVDIVHTNNSTNEMFIKTDLYKFANSVLANLLTNSIKFSQDQTLISIETYQKDGHAHLNIHDRGIGIPDSILNNIFEMNKKTSRLGINGEKGTGYGMPIVKSIIEGLGGEIEIISRDINSYPKAHGTDVLIKIPLYSEDQKSNLVTPSFKDRIARNNEFTTPIQ